MVDSVQQVNQTQSAIPVPQPPVNKQKKTYRRIITIAIILTVVILILYSISSYLFSFFWTHSLDVKLPTLPDASSQQAVATLTPEIVDTAPALPANQKSKILVHHSDSTFSIFLVPIYSVEAYKKTLPQGDTVVKVTNP